MQVYLPRKHKSVSSLKGLLDCLEDVMAQMDLNLFNLNGQKTEVTVFGPCHHYDFGPLKSYKNVMFLGLLTQRFEF